MNLGRWRAVNGIAVSAVLSLCSCRGEGASSLRSETDIENASEAAPPSPMAAAPSPPLPPLCLLAGSEDVQREDAFTDIVVGYLIETDGCRARRLAGGMSRTQTNDWGNYLMNYSFALFGCPLLFDPLPGGVDAFGLSNTEAVGVPNLLLGPDDAAYLIDTYLSSVVAELAIAPEDLAALRERLERAAASQIDASSSGLLSDCP